MYGYKSQDSMEKAVKKLFEQDNGLSDRLRVEENELQAIKCSDPELGHYLHETELPAVVDIFQGPQECFDRHYPNMSAYDLDERNAIARKLEAHAIECEHCKTKVASDASWKIIVDAAFEIAET